MSISSDRVKNTREKRREIMIKSMGGCCALCKYTNPTSLVFHHINPVEKELSFSRVRANNINWPLVVIELRKCILLCANCHNEVHAKGLEQYRFTSTFNEKYADIQSGKSAKLDVQFIPKYCNCGNKLSTKQLKYCSIKCMGIDRAMKGTIVDWEREMPNIVYLREIEKLTYKEIGNVYNVSDNTISKHYKNRPRITDC